MPRLFVVEMFVRYTEGDRVVEVPWDYAVDFGRAWELAHCNVDGSPPTPAQCGDDAALYAAASAIIGAEAELKEPR